MTGLCQTLDRLPPCGVRLIAKINGIPMSSDQIAKSSGLTKWKVLSISRSDTWEGVSVGDRDSFMLACGLDPVRLRRPIAYLKRALSLKDGLRHLGRMKRERRQGHFAYYLSLMDKKPWRRKK